MIHLEAAEERKIGEKDSHRHYCVLNEVYPEVGVSTPSALMTELRAHVKVADPSARLAVAVAAGQVDVHNFPGAWLGRSG